MIVILDYDMGNVGSIHNMLKKIGNDDVCISRNPKVIVNADKLILPGVGAYDMGMTKLNEYGLIDLIKLHVEQKKALLGICLGMQLLGRRSEEGKLAGLGIVPFDCVRFSFSMDVGLRIPHMGWDRVTYAKDDPILRDLIGQQRYYFVHSYHSICDSKKDVLMFCDYGYPFAAAVRFGNIYGFQFHPEKSHHYGMALLKNFVRSC